MDKRIAKSELQLLEQMWKLGPSSVREIHESLSEENRLAYTTVQTMLVRLEEKNAVRRVKKIGNALIFEAVFTREAVHRRLIRDLLDLFGGSAKPVISHLVESGDLSLADIRAIEKQLKRPTA
ncbi:BlaI/MecI/CopY family transcriptional regulator [Granulicella tundricola]|uniref:Transcriptional repressor, CopY family n=1 Tax=Granulicella tundricola (strain ATCC BAA-1859 / DSM 23138 / MP5ACTX9) TaxID=1198114 RepID=E8X2S2_GRATM|nr:BlaI/MecI/CopY family transcriptional regulator [Granulicella tundricola]ADW70369.1 transcriptional repressor, CopY family [Granulicella tundricola MP5ACTX9]